MDRDSIMFALTERFKDAIAEYAHENGDISISQLCREAVAEKIGYDLKADKVKRGRPMKYRNDAERKIAIKRRNENRRIERKALVQALAEEHARQQRAKDAAGMRESLVRKGVDPDSE
jgi:hypothetical protein